MLLIYDGGLERSVFRDLQGLAVTYNDAMRTLLIVKGYSYVNQHIYVFIQYGHGREKHY